MLTVADIRKAIEGLPDDADVCLMVCVRDYDPDDFIVTLTGFSQDEGRAMVIVEAEAMDEDGDFDDMDDDEIEAFESGR